MGSIRFKSDTGIRRRLMAPEAFGHPAKMHISVLQEIASRYGIRAGDWVLDPMGGIGTTLVLALQGINVCLVELEGHFCRPALASWEKMRRQPMLGHELGEVLILQGDAQALPLGRVDSAIFSPPYSESVSSGGDQLKALHSVHYQPPSRPTEKYRGKAVRSNQGYTRPDAIVTSPPFQDQEPAERKAWLEQYKRRSGKPAGFGRALQAGYTRPSTIITSPPYEGVVQGNEAQAQKDIEHRHARLDAQGVKWQGRREAKTAGELSFVGGYGQTQNIGNLRSDAYWQAMTAVYQECHRVLKPRGIMVLVLKGFTRDGRYVDLPAQTHDLVESLGFIPFDHWRRELWSLSFWRILQRRRNPDAFDERFHFEEVLAFRKAEQGVEVIGWRHGGY